MRQMIIYASDNLSKSYDFINGGISINADKTSFKYTPKYNELLLNDYAVLEEDESYTPQNITVEAILKHGDAREFKQFVREVGKTFILKIWNEIEGEEDAKWVLVKKGEEEIAQIASTDYDKITMTFITVSNYIKIKNKSIQLNTNANTVGNYYASDHSVTEDGYNYAKSDHSNDAGFIYGSTTNTVNNFTVQLPKNNGDRKMYLQFTLIDFIDNPQYGIGAHAELTDRSFISTSLGILSGQYNLINNSFTPFKKIILEAKDLNTGLPDINIENKRDYTKDTYLYIKPNEQPRLFMKNIYTAHVTCYEQYTNL